MRYLPHGFQREIGIHRTSELNLTNDVPLYVLDSRRSCAPLCHGPILTFGIYFTRVSTIYRRKYLFSLIFCHQQGAWPRWGGPRRTFDGHSRRWGPSARICVELQRDPLILPLLTSKARTAAVAFVDSFGRIDELQAMTFSDILFAVRRGARYASSTHWDSHSGNRLPQSGPHRGNRGC